MGVFIIRLKIESILGFGLAEPIPLSEDFISSDALTIQLLSIPPTPARVDLASLFFPSNLFM
jgi:hypothetical protein